MQVASSSSFYSPLEHAFGPSSQRSFPTSSARDDPPPNPTAPLYDPLNVLARPHNPYPSDTSAWRPKPRPIEIAPGHLSDGRLTVDHPLVVEHLASPSPLSYAAKTSSEGKAVWSLSALAVALDPAHPAYNHFWGKDVLRATTKFVANHEGISLMYHPTIIYFNDWELFLVIRDHYQRWLKENNVPAEPAVRRNLRKRKEAEEPPAAGQAAVIDDAASPPPAKRTRTTSAHTPKRTTTSSAPHKPSPLSLSVVLPPPSTEPAPSADTAKSKPTPASAPVRTSQRPRKKSSHAREAEEHAAAAEEAPAPRQTVRRAVSSGASSSASSSSSSSSSSTAVPTEQPTPTRSRSGSASSALTAVDIVAALQTAGKGKEKPVAATSTRATRAQTRASATPAPSELSSSTPAPDTDGATATELEGTGDAEAEAVPPASRPKRARQSRATTTRKPRRK